MEELNKLIVAAWPGCHLSWRKSKIKTLFADVVAPDSDAQPNSDKDDRFQLPHLTTDLLLADAENLQETQVQFAHKLASIKPASC